MGDRYELIGEIGRGGFGTVYLGRHRAALGFVRNVAIKLLHADEGPGQAGQRFRDEARLLALLSHRAIVGATDLTRVHNRWAVVMEHVDGASLTDLVRANGPLPVRAALQLIAEIASALDHAWRTEGPDGRPLQLLHRDVKPGNLMLTAAGQAKLLDFGIARAQFAAREARTEDERLGSASYMAPERWLGRRS